MNDLSHCFEKIDIWLWHDKKSVSFKFLSRSLDISADQAKECLLKYAKLKREPLSDIHPPHVTYVVISNFKIMLVPQEQLDNILRNHPNASSHIYCLSPASPNHLDMLVESPTVSNNKYSAIESDIQQVKIAHKIESAPLSSQEMKKETMSATHEVTFSTPVEESSVDMPPLKREYQHESQSQSQSQQSPAATESRRKIIRKKTFINERGYTVTEDVVEWVNDNNDTENTTVNQQRPEEAEPSKPMPAKAAAPPQKTQQKTLANFFSKKT